MILGHKNSLVDYLDFSDCQNVYGFSSYTVLELIHRTMLVFQFFHGTFNCLCSYTNLMTWLHFRILKSYFKFIIKTYPHLPIKSHIKMKAYRNLHLQLLLQQSFNSIQCCTPLECISLINDFGIVASPV